MGLLLVPIEPSEENVEAGVLAGEPPRNSPNESTGR